MDLVDSLPTEDADAASAAGNSPQQMESPTLLWRDYDSGTFSEIRMALDSAGIPYNREDLSARLVYTEANNPLEIWVPAANMPEAERLRDEIVSSSSSAAGSAQPSSVDYVLPAEDYEGADNVRDENVTRELYPEDASAEIWSGADVSTAEILKSCLAEIGVACYVDRPESDPDSDSATGSHGDVAAGLSRQPLLFAVRVLPEDEKRARAIVRQVVEGVPPE